ncbi:MAG: hypothetical protein QXU99_03430 [Candidatus Bathyarchaeia archaeon]
MTFTGASSFQINQKSPNAWLALWVFAVYFILALVFGIKPIMAAAKLSAVNALSPVYYSKLGGIVKYRALSRSGIIFKVALRNLFRHKTTTLRLVFFA